MDPKINHILKLTFLSGLSGFLGSAILQVAVRVLFSGKDSLFQLPPFSMESAVSSLLTLTLAGAACGFVLGLFSKPRKSASEGKEAADEDAAATLGQLGLPTRPAAESPREPASPREPGAGEPPAS